MVIELKRLRLRIAVWIWARLLPLLAYRRDLESLLALTAPPARTPYVGLAARQVTKRVKKLTRNVWFMRDRPCLRQGVLAYRFLKLAGFDPTLHFGVERESVAGSRLAAHCWIALDGQVVLNAPKPNIVEILTYEAPPGGMAVFAGVSSTPSQQRIPV